MLFVKNNMGSGFKTACRQGNGSSLGTSHGLNSDLINLGCLYTKGILQYLFTFCLYTKPVCRNLLFSF